MNMNTNITVDAAYDQNVNDNTDVSNNDEDTIHSDIDLLTVADNRNSDIELTVADNRNSDIEQTDADNRNDETDADNTNDETDANNRNDETDADNTNDETDANMVTGSSTTATRIGMVCVPID